MIVGVCVIASLPVFLCSGLNESNFIHINVTLFISDIPFLQSDQIKYLYNLKSAVEIVLNLPSRWEVEVLPLYSSTARRSGQYIDLLVNIMFSCALAGPGEMEQLRSKLDGQSFVDGLNAMGFKVSRHGASSIQDDNGSNLALSPLVIGLCCAFGFVPGITILICLRRIRAHSKDRTHAANCIGERHGDNQEDKSRNNYSKEYDEVLQLISKLQISVSWLADAYLRQALEARIEASEGISAYDRAAALQLLSEIELEENLADQFSDRKTLLEQRIAGGPFTEIHSRMLKQICCQEIFDIPIPKYGNNLDTAGASDESCTPTNETPTVGGLDLTEFSDLTESPSAAVAPQSSLQDVLFLLKTCGLDPYDLMQKESRMLMEEILTTRQGPLQAVHLAVPQLLSKAEVDSDLSIDTERKHLLEKRMKKGPLNADHLRAVRCLRMFGSNELSLCASVYPKPFPETGAPSESGSMLTVNPDHGSGAVKRREVSEIYLCDALFSPKESTEQSEASRFLDKIHKDQSSLILFSSEETSALQVFSTAHRRQAAYGALLRPKPESTQIISLGDSDLTKSPSAAVAPQSSLQDVLFLLKTCGLDPYDLMQKESRMLMEEILTTRQGPLQAVHLAVPQLLSKAEVDSDLSIDTERKHLLEKRMKKGPLNADHLRAVRCLRIFGKLGRGAEASTDSQMLHETGATKESGSMLTVNPERGSSTAKRLEAPEICSNLVFFDK